MNSPEYGDIARPDLPRPNCRVKLVCGPVAAGKSTYVRRFAGKGDIVIDLDTIAKERGFTRDRPQGEVGNLLRERNKRLAALASEPKERVAWVIMSAPSRALRAWWCEALGVRVQAGDLIVITQDRQELRRRIMSDPDRMQVRGLHLWLVDKWLERERWNDPGPAKSGVDADGFPTDPLHPLNKQGRTS
jgi:hypothetical protein